MSDRTLVIIKPDAVERGLVGEIIRRIEAKGLVLERLELRTIDRPTAERHYAEHEGKPFFGELIDFITRSPSVLAIARGPGAQVAWRQMMGATNPLEAAPGTIRGDHALVTTENLVHGSDAPESAEREIGLFFAE